MWVQPLRLMRECHVPKFDNKHCCNLRLQFLFKKINIIIFFENITIGLYVLYALNTCQILYQSDFFYYMIHELIFYA